MISKPKVREVPTIVLPWIVANRAAAGCVGLGEMIKLPKGFCSLFFDRREWKGKAVLAIYDGVMEAHT